MTQKLRGTQALRPKYINKQTIISTTKGISWLQRYFHLAYNKQVRSPTERDPTGPSPTSRSASEIETLASTGYDYCVCRQLQLRSIVQKCRNHFNQQEIFSAILTMFPKVGGSKVPLEPIQHIIICYY